MYCRQKKNRLEHELDLSHVFTEIQSEDRKQKKSYPFLYIAALGTFFCSSASIETEVAGEEWGGGDLH